MQLFFFLIALKYSFGPIQFEFWQNVSYVSWDHLRFILKHPYKKITLSLLPLYACTNNYIFLRWGWKVGELRPYKRNHCEKGQPNPTLLKPRYNKKGFMPGWLVGGPLHHLTCHIFCIFNVLTIEVLAFSQFFAAWILFFFDGHHL